MPVSRANVAMFCSISIREGKYDVPSMSRGWIARCRSSSGISEFQSYRS